MKCIWCNDVGEYKEADIMGYFNYVKCMMCPVEETNNWTCPKCGVHCTGDC